MKLFSLLILQILSLLGLATVDPVFAFLNPCFVKSNQQELAVTGTMASLQPGANICDLPGDPSLILTTNVDLGDKKLDVMKGMYPMDPSQKLLLQSMINSLLPRHVNTSLLEGNPEGNW